MTPKEFKAWFEGFTEAFTGCPSKAQWARIKDRVGEIDGHETTERVYVDRYIYRYWPAYQGWSYATLTGIGTCGGLATGTAGNLQSDYRSQLQNCSNQAVGFSSTEAMAALGRAEAQQLDG